MTVSVVSLIIGVLLCLGLRWAAHPLLNAQRPSRAVPLLAAASLLIAVSVGSMLAVIGLAVIGQASPIAAEERWSAAALRAQVPIPHWIGALAFMSAGMVVVSFGWRAARILAALTRAQRLCRRLRATDGPVQIVDDGSADAYTVAGFRGCVVISRRLLAPLTTPERMMLTAHELSHLTHRHHLYLHAADLAVAANPLLGPVADAVRLGVERWADEDAAAAVGDRVTAGRALARIALLQTALQRADNALRPPAHPARVAAAASVLSAGAAHVLPRVQALLVPARRPLTGPTIAAAAVAVMLLMLSLEAALQTHHAFEYAEWLFSDR